MSLGKLSVEAVIVNLPNPNESSVPNWLRLPNSKSYYDNIYTNWPEPAIALAEQEIQGFERTEYDKIVVIYARSEGSSFLYPRSSQLFGLKYWTSEIGSEDFNTIGVHCHELGHIMFGFLDHYSTADVYPQPEKETFTYHDLMGLGSNNGSEIGNAPAPINPVYRAQQNWLVTNTHIIPLTTGQALNDDVFIDDNQNPRIYRLDASSQFKGDYVLGRYYLIENRQKVSPYDKYAPSSLESEEGILVWQKLWYSSPSPSLIDLIEADDEPLEYFGNYFPGTTDIKIFRCDGGGGFTINGKNGAAPNFNYNVTFYGDGSIWSGSISDKVFCTGEILCDNVSFSNKVYTVAGTKFISNSGKTVNFHNGGYIIANGVENFPITFQGNNSTWSGLFFSGSSASQSLLNYCTVKDVLTYGGSALSVSNTLGFTITNSTISNNFNYGTSGISFTNAGSPNISFNTINNNGSYGIKFYNTNGNLWKNSIQGNYSGGIYCSNYASPFFGKTGFYPSENGNNLVQGGYYGVVANYFSNPFIGSINNGYSGYNSIFDNSTARILAEGYCDIFAELNWWGVESPDPSWFVNDQDSYISWVPYLEYPYSTDANPEKLTLNRNVIATKTRQVIISSIQTNVLKEKFRSAVESQIKGNYSEAFLKLKEIIESDTADMRKISLIEVMKLYSFSKDDDIFDYFSKYLSNDPNVQLAYAQLLELRDNVIDANNIRTIVANTSKDTDIQKYALLDLFHSKLSKSSDGTQDVLDKLKSKYGNDVSVQEAIWFSQNNNFEKEKIGKKQTTPTNSFKAFDLYQNYPNPFNPFTTISFDIPVADHVTLIVFDCLGRKIATLLNGYHSKGKYSVDFDASAFGSGLYFYKLAVGSYVSIKKMMLVK